MQLTPVFQNGHEEACFKAAAYFTVVRGFAAKRTRVEVDSFGAALEVAKDPGDGRSMIYAVTGSGSFAHIVNA